jgi:glycine/D-amino acid oxidase-like deaminating enzyme
MQRTGCVMRVVICGGGVIGASIAYFLSCRGIKAIVLERAGIACAASGKAGGFLARDWCDGTPLQPLARHSFDLHARLAQQIGDDWGYRCLDTYGGFGTSREQSPDIARPNLIDWVSAGVRVNQRLGTTDRTAQVHPGLFTAAMMRAAERQGAELRPGKVTGVVRRTGRVEGVEVDGEVVEADAVVIAMGPWSLLATAWLPLPAVYGLKGHSLIFKTGQDVSAEALFLEYQEATGEVQAPELFPRPDGTTYVCGISSESPLPIDPAAVAPDPDAIERLERICNEVSPALASAKIVARQACYRPITRDGLPVIGRVPGVEGAYIATGHSVWGILNAPATGEAMAELITDGAAHAIDLSPFDSGRLPPLDPAGAKYTIRSRSNDGEATAMQFGIGQPVTR